MEDRIENLSAVVDALSQYSTALTEIQKLMNGESNFEKNKEEFRSAWQSENANSFLGEYSKLTTSVTNAIESLIKYQSKIQNVVTEFQGFDTTITTGE